MADSKHGTSLLATAHSLRALVVSASLPAHHSLSATPPAALPAIRAALHDALAQLRQGLGAFSALALPPATEGEVDADIARPNRDRDRDRDKHLSLLRDAAQAEAGLLQARAGAGDTGAGSLKRRRRDGWADRFPARVPSMADGREGHSTVETLELVAADLGLVTFRDETPAGGIILSLGGKLVVVDVELSPAPAPRVERTKVAYVVNGADCVCPAASDKLHALLSGEGEAQRKWRGVRSVLEHLQELDEATERTGDDCFARLNRMLPSELAAALAGTESPRLLPTTSTLYPLLHYYSTPLASLHPSHTLLSPSPPLSALDAYTALPGVYTASVALAAVEDAPHVHSERPYVARLCPPVPITREVARRVCEVLEMPVGARTGAGEEEVMDEGWVEALLDAGGLERGWPYEVTHPNCPPLAFTLAPPPHTAGFASAGRPPPRLATHLRFAHPSQLLRALDVLRAQVRANELLFGIARVGASPVESSGNRGAKRRRVTAKGAADVSLEELFAPPSTPAPLPISVHPSTSATTGPGVTLTLPSPSGSPIALSISFPLPTDTEGTGAQLAVRLHASDTSPALEVHVTRVLEVAEDLGLAVSEVVRGLQGAEA